MINRQVIRQTLPAQTKDELRSHLFRGFGRIYTTDAKKQQLKELQNFQHIFVMCDLLKISYS